MPALDCFKRKTSVTHPRPELLTGEAPFPVRVCGMNRLKEMGRTRVDAALLFVTTMERLEVLGLAGQVEILIFVLVLIVIIEVAEAGGQRCSRKN